MLGIGELGRRFAVWLVVLSERGAVLEKAEQHTPELLIL